MSENLTVISQGKEIPISELPPMQRLGVIIHRARVNAGMAIDDAVKAINGRFPHADGYTDYLTENGLDDIEKGMRPISEGQIKAFAEVFGAHLSTLLIEAAQLWTREVWSDGIKHSLEIESVRSKALHLKDDREELLAIIRLGRSTLDAATLCMTQYANRLIHGEMVSHSRDGEGIEAMRDSINGLADVWNKLVDRIDPRG